MSPAVCDFLLCVIENSPFVPLLTRFSCLELKVESVRVGSKMAIVVIDVRVMSMYPTGVDRGRIDGDGHKSAF